ncbi:Magnesium transporter MRS2-11, chloroplastic [Tetrabaena socialis]|uniref:Magnesium transporter MRS2-11, chloroplastic n=1 Tax=Tetrabaena socialis TaxID=47790 RepID=A0A2J8AHV0_9CHLO|nr:Magnesium transporter MRS2-11, chloroplastic [Tetrabaena socialis]|eukprot:PNH12093.1 Magnesium transporter MRS2-11, chloroplastic [Tetrabaena socialis]
MASFQALPWKPVIKLRSELVVHCTSASGKAQPDNHILTQLEASGAATHAAQSSGSNGGIVSGYTSSSGSLAASMNSGDTLSSMDEYSSSQMDFSDLANEDMLGDGMKGEGAANAYGKANYEVLRLDASAKARRFYVRRRDLLREHRLQPRDLRRIDPSIDFTKTSPSITIKEDVLLLNLGGVSREAS